jgi:hypothetical protein
MDCNEAWLGSTLLAELCTGDGMNAAEAATWISRKTGRPYDPGAMYHLIWSDQEDAKTWSTFQDLRVKVMSDFELDRYETEYRKTHGLAPRRPWETRLFDSSRGRAAR